MLQTDCVLNATCSFWVDWKGHINGNQDVRYLYDYDHFPDTHQFDEHDTYLVISPTPTPSPSVISVTPLSSNVTLGKAFSVNVKIESGVAFNAARATIAVSPNLSITSITNPSSNSCNFHYTTTPTSSNPSFAGAIFNGSSINCNVYTLVLTPLATGTASITVSNGSIKSYADNSELIDSMQSGSYSISSGPTPTPTPTLEFSITNPLMTYDSSFILYGTKLSNISNIYVNGSDINSSYPTSTSWQNLVNLDLGENTFAVYGSDGLNQTATQTVTVNRHTLGDINGDGYIDLIDASLFAVDWDKTENLTYLLSDMNSDGQVNLTDLSILAKLIE